MNGRASTRAVNRRIDLGQISLSVREQGTGPPIIFLHGFPDNGDTWGLVADCLSNSFQCILPDQRGYRQSDAPYGVASYDIQHLISDVDALADALGLTQFILAGHDWGGVLAWWYAARRGDRVSRLIIANAPHPALFQRAIINDPAQRLASQYISALRHADAETGFPFATTPMLNWYRAAPFLVPAPEQTASLPSWVNAEDFTIAMPTLVLWGVQDTVLLPVLLEDLASFVPDLLVKRFEAGHSIICEIPCALAEVMQSFIQ